MMTSTVAASPAPWRMRHFIDANKGLTGLVVLGLMAAFGAWDSVVAWIYLAEHGLYGILWVTKSRLFGDKQFEQPVTLAYGATIFMVLCLYWATPYLIVSRAVVLPAYGLGLSVLCFGAGVFAHFSADMQKFMHLQLRPGTLLCSGVWRHCRNPNYLGELLIYGAFVALGRSPIPVFLLGLMVVGVWIPNMRRKDRSLSRYPGFAAYKASSCCFIPGMW